MVFIGAQAEQIEQTVIGILKTFIEGKFATEPYLTRMSPWGGVQVTDTDEDADRFVATASPFIFMSIAEGSHTRELFRKKDAGTLYMGTQHDMDIVLELCVTERCRNAIKPLRDAVGNMIDTGYFELEALGLNNTSIKPTSNNSQGVQLFNPHTISCVVFTIPKPD
jgi:hypothetical protein